MMKVEEGRAVKEWPCKHQDCRKKITKGDRYFLWHLNGNALRQHVAHGEPAANPATKATKKATAKKKVAKKTSKKISRKRVTKKGSKQ